MRLDLSHRVGESCYVSTDQYLLFGAQQQKQQTYALLDFQLIVNRKHIKA